MKPKDNWAVLQCCCGTRPTSLSGHVALCDLWSLMTLWSYIVKEWKPENDFCKNRETFPRLWFDGHSPICIYLSVLTLTFCSWELIPTSRCPCRLYCHPTGPLSRSWVILHTYSLYICRRIRFQLFRNYNLTINMKNSVFPSELALCM